MPNQEVVEIYRAKNGFQARIFADALENAGVRAQIQGDLFYPGTQSAVHPIIDAAPWWDAPRILVFADDAQKAKQILLQLEDRERDRAIPTNQTGPDIEVVCEECGKRAAYPAAQHGTVQDCPHCSAYVDVGESSPAEAMHDDDESDADDV